MGGAMGQPSPLNYDDTNNDNNVQLEDNFSQLSFSQKSSSKHDSQQSNKQQFIGQIEDQQHSMGNHRVYQNNSNASSTFNDMDNMSANMQQIPQSRVKQNQINTASKPRTNQQSSQIQNQSQQSHIEQILNAMAAYNDFQLKQLFIMHQDPMKQNKLVLNQNQFIMVRNIYKQAFLGNRWSLSDDQQVKQVFINLLNIYEKVYLPKLKKQ